MNDGYVPTPATKRRIVHKDGRRGVQLEDDGYGNLLVQWGTVNVRDTTTGEHVSKPITEWVGCYDVTTLEEPVYFGTEAEKNRELMYNPLEHL